MNTDPSTSRPSGSSGVRPLRLVVLCPHIAPDTAPTGTVMTRIVDELAARGHEVHVVTALPWYRTHTIEPGWEGSLVRVERTAWGSITRVHPFPGHDKTNLVRRALGFAGFSVLAGLSALVAGTRWGRAGCRGPRRVDGVLAMSPPLTLGLTGWLVHLVRRGPLVFNIQDVFPDAAVETGAITNRRVIAVARWLERVSYERSDAVTVLSDDLRDNVVAKVGPTHRSAIRVIPNFVDTEAIVPLPRDTAYRRRMGLGDSTVVMYAGNVGFSQSLDLLLHAAREIPDVVFVINGEGAARPSLEEAARDIPNVRIADYVAADELSDLLASADLHVVPLKTGLGRVSVPSKTYSILAAGRPVLAAIDPGTEVPRILEASGAGEAVAPDAPEVFVAALRRLLADPADLQRRGAAGRLWVEQAVSPAAVGLRYDELFREISRR
jgi:colanic acid biosynthesis glycosyl transferase WcaI